MPNQRAHQQFPDDVSIDIANAEDASAWSWLVSNVHEIEDAFHLEDICTTQFQQRFVDTIGSGWTTGPSAQEALSIIGYLSITMGYPMMQEFVQLVLAFRKCQRKSASTALPDEWWLLARKLDFFAEIARSFWATTPLDFSAILHHVVVFGEMWNKPLHPEAGEVWREFYAKNIFFAPDFASLLSRYAVVFGKYKYQRAPRSMAEMETGVAVLITYGDLDGHTLPDSAKYAFQQLQSCKVEAELKTGKHCVSDSRCMREVVDAFYNNYVHCQSDLKLESGTILKRALNNLQNCAPATLQSLGSH